VNAEYQSKITELSELNTDMDNLFRSTEIGTIFLDNSLRIRKFTPAVTKEINLLKQDIGRPLSDLSGHLLKAIDPDVKAVLNTSKKIEKNIQTASGTWYLIQILPYLNENEVHKGIVVSLVNITELKNAEKTIQMQHDLLKRVLEINPAATIMVSKEGNINFVNRQAEITLGFLQENLLGMRLDSSSLNFTDLDGHPISEKNNPFEMIKKSKKQVVEYVMGMNQANQQQLVFTVTGNPMFNEKGDVEGAVFKFEKVAHQTLKENRND
jgi:two-component system CheB/CheR fusion protein